MKYSEHEVFLLLLGFGLAGSAVEETLLWFFKGIKEDVREQVAKLISDDVVLLGGDELNERFLLGLNDDHLDIVLDDQYLITFLDGLVSLTKDLLS